MPQSNSGLAREIQRIIQREVQTALAPLAQVLSQLAGRGAEAGTQQEPGAPRQRGRPPRSTKATWSPESIRALRTRLGLTQKAFGKQVGVTPVAIYQWEAGRAKPRGKSAQALSRVSTQAARTSPQATAPAGKVEKKATVAPKRRRRRRRIRKTAGKRGRARKKA